jgi:glycosyltransferase involved in cell wall biosynthesis
MRILQVVQKPQRRGAEIFAVQLSRQLSLDGHDVRIAYLYLHDSVHALPIDEHDLALGGREDHYLEALAGIHPKLLARLTACIDEFRPDVVQANGGRTVKYCAAAAVGRPRRNWVLIYRNIGEPYYWTSKVRRYVYSRLVVPKLDGVVGVSGATLEAVRNLYSLSIPLAHIPCAVDQNAVMPTLTRQAVRQAIGASEDTPVIVFVGSLTPEKRVDRLLNATTVIRRAIPAASVWIIGDGPLRAALEQQAERLSLTPNVRFLGSRDRVVNFMRAGDVVALTSDSEGMPAVLLEAGLSGLPVVATRVGGVPECVADGVTGILVDPRDEHGLVSALLQLLREPERRRAFGQAARVRLQERFMMTTVARQYCTFYQRVLAR